MQPLISISWLPLSSGSREGRIPGSPASLQAVKNDAAEAFRGRPADVRGGHVHPPCPLRL